jgi:low affinity Fe/Cu permease
MIMDQIWAEITALDWVSIISTAVSAICFILTCVILIQAKVNTIKLQAQNAKLQEGASLSEAEYRKKELALRQEYNDQLKVLRGQLVAKENADMAAKEAKQKAETQKIADSIAAAQDTIDSIINGVAADGK